MKVDEPFDPVTVRSDGQRAVSARGERCAWSIEEFRFLVSLAHASRLTAFASVAHAISWLTEQKDVLDLLFARRQLDVASLGSKLCP